MIANNDPLSNIPRIDFSPPIHHDPAVVAAEFTLHTAANGDTVTGVIYANGSCSCSEHKSTGRCIHAAAWLLECWSAVYAMADADAERRAETYDSLRVIDIFAAEVTPEAEARYGPGASYEVSPWLR